MKDKKFLILIVLAIGWLLLFAGTAMGEIKLSPNVERFATVIVLLWGAYWTFSTIFWAKKDEPTTPPQSDCHEGTCGCNPKASTPSAPETKSPKS